ncbi:hypothetical protein V5O48_007609 [Marasmius crinis-equi]|uniref:Uncharacterized protein n=1 Tax=Marasmius crinis-equi TaxID=585013 RepID=A0ABR3FGD2_9AGAR
MAVQVQGGQGSTATLISPARDSSLTTVIITPGNELRVILIMFSGLYKETVVFRTSQRTQKKGADDVKPVARASRRHREENELPEISRAMLWKEKTVDR